MHVLPSKFENRGVFASRRALFLLAVLPILAACQRSLPRKAVLPDFMNEVSGVYCAGPDSLWWHNDSGDGPLLYLTDRRGRFRDSLRVPGTAAVDWEDMTADPYGHLFIGDFGNNRNGRRDLRILRFRPDTGACDTIAFSYPDQRAFPPPAERAHFDMEAMLWHGGRLHLFSKARLGTGVYQTRHYTLPDRPGRYVARLRDSLWLDKRVVTAAAISADGSTVALLSYYFKIVLGILPITRTSIFLFRDFPEDRFLRGTVARRRVPKGIPPTQYEALDFCGDSLLVVGSERTILFRQKLRYLDPGRSGRKRP